MATRDRRGNEDERRRGGDDDRKGRQKKERRQERPKRESAETAAQESFEEVGPTYATEIKVFNKWATEEVTVNDQSLKDYIPINGHKFSVFVPHTAGRYQKKAFRKAQCPIVERLVNSLMMHGRNTGKKLMAIRIVKTSFEIIHLVTRKNPLQVFVDAVQRAGPREDSTRIGSAGVVRRQSVDVSPLRRVNQAIYLMTTGARNNSFRNLKSIAECLADEIINAANDNQNSFAIKKKDEIERVAKANR
jgi:small subunit ribosomal protein S5e